LDNLNLFVDLKTNWLDKTVYLDFVRKFILAALDLLETDDVRLFVIKEIQAALLDPRPEAVNIPVAKIHFNKYNIRLL